MQLIPHGNCVINIRDIGIQFSYYDFIFPVLKFAESGKPSIHLGSCFVVANGPLLMTAAHLFQSFLDINAELKKPEILRKRRLTWDLRDLAVAVPILNGGKFKGVAPIASACIFPQHDVALLIPDMTSIEDQLMRFISLVDAPREGELVRGWGYPGEFNSFSEFEEDGRVKVAGKVALGVSEGKILRIHNVARDSGLCSFPCVESDVTLLPGASGGPLISAERLGVIGVNSASIGGNSIHYKIDAMLDDKISFDGVELRLHDGTYIKYDGLSMRDLAKVELCKII